jgi:hypothetical protein
MTMPHLMNCAHSNDGWCLSCVRGLNAEREKLADDAVVMLAALKRAEDLICVLEPRSCIDRDPDLIAVRAAIAKAVK